MSTRAKRAPPWYWALAAILIGFGFLTALSIGMPLLLLGLALLVLQPFRNKQAIFWPALLGVLAFIVGFILVTPLGCLSESTSLPALPGQPLGPQDVHTTCSNLLGINYSGGNGYHAPLWPALITGLGAGLLTGFGMWRILSRRSRPSPVGEPA